MFTENKPTDVVYQYNWKDLIFITRLRNGTWKYRVNYKKLVKKLNEDVKRNNPKSTYYDLYYSNNTDKVLELGVMIGSKVEELFTRCKISYGDLPKGEVDIEKWLKIAWSE